MSNQSGKPPDLGELPRMVRWYGPRALYQTGRRDLIAGVFGQYADQRTLQWATDEAPEDKLVKRYDYSETWRHDDVWVDYVADLGDGFDSTFSIASLLAAPHIEAEGAEPLPAGQILIMGGDQVYPYASPEDYAKRLIQPYRLADTESGRPGRKLFALPGNHDWYDGLAAFDRVFCEVRDGVSPGLVMGPWHCEQHRSYFAIKLPHDWWIWGLDTQLTRNLDVGQIRYFQSVASKMLDKTKAKIILCIAQPYWHEASGASGDTAYPRNLDRIVQIALDEAKVCAIIAGDLHHYCRYCGLETGLNLITAGGGGAYLSPTHHFKDEIVIPWKEQQFKFSLLAGLGEAKAKTAALFPSRSICKSLSWRNLLFPFYNPAFAFLAIGILYWIMSWNFASTVVSRNWVVNGSQKVCEAVKSCATIKPSITDKFDPPWVSDILTSPRHLSANDYTLLILEAATNNFWLPLFALIIGLGLYYYMAARTRPVRLALTLVHLVAHIAAMGLLCRLFLNLNIPLAEQINSWTGWGWGKPIASTLVYPLEMIFIGGFIGGMIWGIYLFLNSRFLKLHTDDAFSALRIADYKHFLRMHIEPDKLTIYPIGLRRTPRRSEWRKRSEAERRDGVRAAFVPEKPLQPHLIEGPIVIRPSDIKEF